MINNTSPPALPPTRSHAPPKPPSKPSKPSHLKALGQPDSMLQRSTQGATTVSLSPSNTSSFKPSVVIDPSMQTSAQNTAPNTMKQTKVAPNQGKKESVTYGFTLWGHNLGYAAGLLLMVFGLFGVVWADKGYESKNELLVLFEDPIPGLSRIAGYYAGVLGAFVFVFEYFFGLQRGDELTIDSHRYPLRGSCYIALSIPCFFGYPTILPGVIMVIAGVANCIATNRGERVNKGTVPTGSYCLCGEKQSGWGKDTSETKSTSWMESMKLWIRKQRESGQLSQLIIVFIYLLVNTILWVEAFVRWQGILSSFGEKARFAPFAKAFGQLLNFNCSLILFPVLRALLRGLNNYQISPTKSIATYLPLRKNIVFHKFIACIVLFAVIGHVGFHYVNFAINSDLTYKTFGLPPWITGYIITIAMVVIFAGAQARVKRAHYEIFWKSHHFFIFFFGFLLSHGAVFWIWSFVPVLLYISERVLRNSRGSKPFYLKSVKYHNPVVCLEFFPKRLEDFQFREGQYLYLMIPVLSKNEWHPFTISSAHGDLLKDPGRVTLHIRVQRPGSWTHQMKEFFEKMAPIVDKHSYELELTHIDADGCRQPGKLTGPDGQPLICIDGPHAAPAQHYSQYSEVMLVGAGIGLTPAAAIIQAILRHKWKKGFHPETIYFYWVVRHSEVESFQWFINLLTQMQKMLASDRAAGNVSQGHFLEINIFVTRAPKSKSTSPRKKINSIRSVASKGTVRAGIDVDIGFDEEALTHAILNPSVSSKDFAKVVMNTEENPQSPKNKFHDILIWNGRPDWNEIFWTVKQRKPNTGGTILRRDIGVVFCGASVIGKDLKEKSRMNSDLNGEIPTIFSLHKENF